MDEEKLERRERDFLRKRKRDTEERVWRCRTSHKLRKIINR